MFKHGLALWTFFIALLAGVISASAQGPPRSGIYRIQMGTYEEEGGFTGYLKYRLPYASQTFVFLTVDPGATNADLQFLDQNKRGIYFPRLTNGIVSSDEIRFQYVTINPYGSK